MNNVQFTDENLQTTMSAAFRAKGQGGIIGWLMKMGIAKSTAQANMILICLIIICLAIIGISIASDTNVSEKKSFPLEATRLNNL